MLYSPTSSTVAVAERHSFGILCKGAQPAKWLFERDVSLNSSKTEIGQHIDDILDELDIDQKTFCERTKVHSSTITNLRQGNQRLTRKIFDRIDYAFSDKANRLSKYIGKENKIVQDDEGPDWEDNNNIVKSMKVDIDGSKKTLTFEFHDRASDARIKSFISELGFTPNC